MAVEISVIVCALFMLEFEAGMADAEFFFQPFLDRTLYLLNPRPRFGRHDDMTIERGFMLLHLPEMDVVDIGDTIDAPHRFDDGLVVDVRRAAEHQGSDRVADLGYGEVEDVKSAMPMVIAGSTHRMS